MRWLRFLLPATAAAAMLFLIGCSMGVFSLAPAGTGTSQWNLIGQAGFSTDQANNVSVALDGSGNPYVAYSDIAYGGELTVMHYDGTSWGPVGAIAAPSPTMTSTPVDGEELAIDSNKTVYVAYSVGGSLYVGKWNGTSWSVLGGGAVTTNLDGNAGFSFAASGTSLFVAFGDLTGATSGGVTCEEWNGSSWSPLSGGTNFPSTVGSVSLAVESGNPYVAFIDNTNNQTPSVMQYSGTAWSYLGSADFSTASVSTIALAFDGTTPSVVFSQGSSAPPTLMNYTGGSWQQTSAAGLDNVSMYTYLPQIKMVPANGALLLAYYADATVNNATTSGVFVYSNSSGSWTPYSNGNMGTPFALTADSGGAPVVVYADPNAHFRLSVAKP